MDPREMDALVQRLVQNPHDQDAILHAHSAGQQDPRSYAMLLEKVGAATADPALASHWLTEAANVWVLSLNDAHRAARALMIAIDRDPTQAAPAERLAELYREKGDAKALAALLERRAKALAPLAQRDPTMRPAVAGIHEELGRLFAEPPLSNPPRAIESYRRALDYDPSSQYAIYAIREAFKAAGQVAEAIPYYAMEQTLVTDPERRVSLYADEADARRSIGDSVGALRAIDKARQVDPGDPGLKQQLATLVLDCVREGKPLDDVWKSTGAQLFVELAEEYQGEHGYAYSTCALEIEPGNDRAMQLAIYYGEQLGRIDEVAPYASSYIQVNPAGALARDATRVAGDSPPRAAPVPGRGAAPAARSAGPRVAPAADRTLDDLDGVEEEDAEPEPDPDATEALLAKAAQLAAKNRRNEAAGVYRDVLKSDATNRDALQFLQTHYRQARKYGDLRDILLRASRSSNADVESRVTWLREVAGLCESQIRDFETAIQAWQQLLTIDPDETEAKEQLRRLLERANRWDDLAAMLEREAEQESDVEVRISLEKQLAKLHETKRKDLTGAGQAWARIAALTPEDDVAVATAVKLLEKADRLDLAAQVIADCVGSITDETSRGALYKRLGELRRGAGDLVGAGDAYSEAARITSDVAGWEAAEQAYANAEAWAQAAVTANERAQLARTPRQQAALYAVEADYLLRAGDTEAAIGRLDQALDADPTNDDTAATLEQHLMAADRVQDVAQLLLRRAEKHPDKGARVALRKRASSVQRESLGDPAAARDSLSLVLEDGDDPEALSLLSSDAEDRGEFSEAVDYLARLGKVTANRAEQASVGLRQARLLAEGVKDVDAAVDQYRRVLDELDPASIEALSAIATLEEQRGRHQEAAEALEKQLERTEVPEQRVELAGRLADLYENNLEEPRAALRSLNVIIAADPDDFQAVQRIIEIAERLEEWGVVAEHTARLVEVEGDEQEVSRMTRHLAEVLNDKLGRGDDALAALANIGDQGDVECREAFVELGDRLGKKKAVASKLVEWFGHAPPSSGRDSQLHGAFDRFVEVSADAEAASVAKELARMRAAKPEIAERLEGVAVRLRDLDALSIAHDLVVKGLSGPARAEEMVRQAEVLVTAGVDPSEAVLHGEQALTSVAPGGAEPLLERLGNLLGDAIQVIDLYERQIGRCKAPPDRLAALARAAQVAAERDAFERARGFFDSALSAGMQEEALEALEQIARRTDEAKDAVALRTTLAEAFAAGGQGSRDGGRTRAALLRRAALMAFHELNDRERAFGWLGDAIVTHVDDAGLDTLEELASDIGQPQRCETLLTRALGEVFDGPLVRKLLGRRASVRAELLDNKAGAAEDLKRLHELAPSDTEVMEKLSALYTELADYRGMVQLYEDQILRGRDQTQRAELARKVARLWEETLDDAREAADAWRRVLRMKAGDAEATAGLERAKANMLKRASEDGEGAILRSDAPPPSRKSSAPPDGVASMPTPVAPPPALEAERREAEGPRTEADDLAPPAEPEASAGEMAPPVQEAEAKPAKGGKRKKGRKTTEAVEPEGRADAESAPRPSRDEEPTMEAPIAMLKAAASSAASDAAASSVPPPLPPPAPLLEVTPPAPAHLSASNGTNGAASAEPDGDIDVDMSLLDEPPPARTTPPPLPPGARGTRTPPPPPRSAPPMPPSMRGSKPPPPPSMRPSRSPPPPPRGAPAPMKFTDFEARPSDSTEIRQPHLSEPPPPPAEDDGEEIADDELFE
jgi:tetratricopeptide (TPR) repeat protein